MPISSELITILDRFFHRASMSLRPKIGTYWFWTHIHIHEKRLKWAMAALLRRCHWYSLVFFVSIVVIFDFTRPESGNKNRYRTAQFMLKMLLGSRHGKKAAENWKFAVVKCTNTNEIEFSGLCVLIEYLYASEYQSLCFAFGASVTER